MIGGVISVLILWRARLRGMLRRVVSLAVLVALGGGIMLAGAAGARRTASAQDAVADITNAGEIGSSYVPRDPDEARSIFEAIPAVGDFNQRVGFAVFLPETPISGLSAFANYSDPVIVDRALVVDGRMPTAPEEVLLNEAAAARSGASVGQQLEIVLTPDYQAFFPETLVVVGIGVYPDEVYEDETGAKPTLVLARSFVDAHPDLAVWGAGVARVAPGAGPDELARQLTERGLPVDADQRDDRARSEAAIRPLVVTLVGLAILVGVATTVVAGQALQRLVQRSPSEALGLAAAGCTRPMLLALDVGVAATVTVAGAIGSIVVAVLASPLFPLGQARRLATLGGFDVDLTVLGTGAVALLLAITGVLVATSWWRGRGSGLRPGAAPRILENSPAASAGLRFATGRRALPGTVASVAVGLAAVVAAVVFTGSMDSLVARPDLAGFNWDLAGRDSYDEIDSEIVAEQLGGDPAIERIAGLTFGDASVDGVPQRVGVWAAIEGSPWPTLVAGRAPQGPNEILAGTGTLDRLGYDVGDRFTVGFNATSADDTVTQVFEVDMTVVGTAVSPPIGLPGADTPRLDEGLLVRQEDLTLLLEGAGGAGDADLSFEFGGAVLFDLADLADPGSIKAQFPDGLPDSDELVTEWFETAQPAEVIQSGAAVDLLAPAIAALLIMVTATIAHNLLGFVRERRNDFSVLCAVGFTRRQIRATVLWQSGLVVGAALLAAVPLGIAVGRWLYRGFASDIGVIVQPVVAWPALTATILGAAALIQAVALIPAQRARRSSVMSINRLE